MRIKVELASGRAVTGTITEDQEEQVKSFIAGDGELPGWLDLVTDEARVLTVQVGHVEVFTELPA